VPIRRLVLVVGFVYVVEGFPMGMFVDVVPVWLRREGVDLQAIGWLSLLGLAWSAKVLWSPLVDRWGERRTWIAGALALMAAALAALAWLAGAGPPAERGLAGALPFAGALLGLYCLASATQDVAIDAYTIGVTPRGREGPVNATRVTAYRLGVIAAGGGLLLLPDLVGWAPTLSVAALLSAAFGLGVLATPHAEVPEEARRETLAPLWRWLRLPGAWGVLAFVLLFRVGDLSMAPMVKPFWVDRGYGTAEIGTVTTTLGSVATVAGAAAGGAFVARRGIASGLLWLGLAALASNLAYAAAALLPATGRGGMYAASLVESFSAGLAVTAFLSFCMRITEREHAAVQYAVLSALFVLPGRLLGGVSGEVAERAGYAAWFGLTALGGLPALAFLPSARRRLEHVARHDAPDVG